MCWKPTWIRKMASWCSASKKKYRKNQKPNKFPGDQITDPVPRHRHGIFMYRIMASHRSMITDIVIETPKGARNKYVFDPERNAFRLRRYCRPVPYFLLISVLSRVRSAQTATRWTCW